MIGQRVKHLRVLDGGQVAAVRTALVESVLADVREDAAGAREDVDSMVGRLRACGCATGMLIAELLHLWNVPRFDPNTARLSKRGASSVRAGSGSADAFGPITAEAEAFAELGADLGARLLPERRLLAHRLNRGPAAVIREQSCNRKLSPIAWIDTGPGKRPRPKPLRPYVASTYAAIDVTCPSSCPFKGDADGPNGCFADAGFTRKLSVELNEAARDMSPEQVIAEEAREIDRAFKGGRIPQDGARGGRDLRLHVGGDVGNEVGARILAAAAARYIARGGGAVWTFTHHWATIPRSAWGPISVLASCESAQDVALALSRGYAVAVVVDQFPTERRAFPASAVLETSVYLGSDEVAKKELRLLPCPAETTKDVTCATCRLCLDRDLGALGVGIAFAVHGKHAQQAREQLVQIRTPGAPPPAKRAPERRHCRQCGGGGHNRSTCPQGKPPIERVRTTGRQYQCGTCLKLGHNARTCPGLGAVV